MSGVKWVDGTTCPIPPEQAPTGFGITQSALDLFVISPCCKAGLSANGDDQWVCKSCRVTFNVPSVPWGERSTHSLRHVYNPAVGRSCSTSIIRNWITMWTGIEEENLFVSVSA